MTIWTWPVWRLRQNRNSLVKPSLQIRIIIMVALLVAAALSVHAIYINNRMADMISHQIGLRGLGVAQTVANMPEVQAAMMGDNPSQVLQPLTQQIQAAVGSEYVVIGNEEGLRLSHPRPERIGLPMVGGDNELALIYGESYVSRATGSLGEAIRGKTAIFNAQGDIIGVVSVGFMMENIDYDIARYLRANWMPLLLTLIFGVLGSFWIARHVKQQIFGLEPAQIAQLFSEREAILQSIHEGVVAVDRQGKVSLINQSARKVLGLEHLDHAINRPVTDLIPNSRLASVLSRGEGDFDQAALIHGLPYVVNRVPIIKEGEVMGAVATFRDQQELMSLSQALNEVSANVANLRVQAHEYSNRLSTLSGLIQLKQYDAAVDLIQQESRLAQEQLESVMGLVSDSVMVGLLFSKLSWASQRKIDFTIDPETSLHSSLNSLGREALMRVIGNLLDNAFDAVQESSRRPRVKLFINDLGPNICVEVDDSGPGISAQRFVHILERGYSTKSGNHQGLGLAMVQETCRDLEGDLYLEQSDLEGACLVAVMAKSAILNASTTGGCDEQ